MDEEKKRELLESMRVEMGISTKEEKNPRVEYIASSNTLKINNVDQTKVDEQEDPKEETLEDKLQKVALAYKMEGRGIG